MINTQGWVKGLGADLLAQIADMAKPTHVFTFQHPNEPTPTENVSEMKTPHTISLSLEPSIYADAPLKLNAFDLRALSMMSYFHSTIRGDSLRWSTSLSLGSMHPWEVQCDLALDSITLCGAEGENVIAAELQGVLTGGLVGLVQSDIRDKAVDTKGFPYVQGGEPPSPQHSRCLGLAFIRAASAQGEWLHLVTPESPHLFAKCRILVKGELELPVTAMLDYAKGDIEWDETSPRLFGVEQNTVPYLQWQSNVTGAGASKRRVRRNVQRRGQM